MMNYDLKYDFLQYEEYWGVYFSPPNYQRGQEPVEKYILLDPGVYVSIWDLEKNFIVYQNLAQELGYLNENELPFKEVNWFLRVVHERDKSIFSDVNKLAIQLLKEKGRELGKCSLRMGFLAKHEDDTPVYITKMSHVVEWNHFDNTPKLIRSLSQIHDDSFHLSKGFDFYVYGNKDLENELRERLRKLRRKRKDDLFTLRQIEIIYHLGSDLQVKEIAELVGIKANGVRAHIRNAKKRALEVDRSANTRNGLYNLASNLGYFCYLNR